MSRPSHLSRTMDAPRELRPYLCENCKGWHLTKSPFRGDNRLKK
jgi:hypothetical protein